MIWIFITLGSITLAASLLGVAASWTVRRQLAAWHGLAIALLVAAWIAEHTTLTGRLCLVAAIALEAIAWWAFRSSNSSAIPPSSAAAPSDAPPSPQAQRRSEPPPPVEPPLEVVAPQPPLEEEPEETPTDREACPPTPDIPESDTPAPPVEPPPEPATELRTTTCVLLRSPCTVAPAVFLASLRRCGRRDAALAPPTSGDTSGASDDDCRIVSGEIVLACNSAAVPVDRVRITEALAHRDDAAMATEAVVDHLAHIAVTTTHPIGMPCDDIVRLHHFAHAALTEFAPVAAAFWPEARLLTTLDELPGLLAMAKDAAARMSATCTQVRRFSLPAPNEGMILLDSLGLSAFGLPDIQVIAADPPGEVVTTALAELVEQFFSSGCTLTEGSSFEMGDQTTWRVSLARSAFAPDRRVVQLAADTHEDRPPDEAEDSTE